METGTDIWVRNRNFTFFDPQLHEYDSDDEDKDKSSLWMSSTIVKKTPVKANQTGFNITISNPLVPRETQTYT